LAANLPGAIPEAFQVGARKNRRRARANRVMRHDASPHRRLDHGPVGVVPWRRGRLERAGFDPALAAALASDDRTDLHALLELVDRGCPPQLAVQILAPLDDRANGRDEHTPGW
jgi:hypothetical protein